MPLTFPTTRLFQSGSIGTVIEHECIVDQLDFTDWLEPTYLIAGKLYEHDDDVPNTYLVPMERFIKEQNIQNWDDLIVFHTVRTYFTTDDVQETFDGCYEGYMDINGQVWSIAMGTDLDKTEVRASLLVPADGSGVRTHC